MRNNASDVQLDSIDRAILEVLQSEGRISNQELAQRVHLSPSACLRRVKALEDSGVIGQYVALLSHSGSRGAGAPSEAPEKPAQEGGA